MEIFGRKIIFISLLSPYGVFSLVLSGAASHDGWTKPQKCLKSTESDNLPTLIDVQSNLYAGKQNKIIEIFWSILSNFTNPDKKLVYLRFK